MRKNVFAMMMVALFATAFVSCSEDSDDEINNEEPQKVESLVSTQWRYSVGTIGQNGFIQVFVSFINDESAAVSINKQEGGPELPSTGGTGTTVFYILGTILLLGSTVILAARRRMQNR